LSILHLAAASRRFRRTFRVKYSDSVAALAKQHLPQIAPVPDMATHTADERFTPVKRGVATLDIWVMAAFAAVTIWVLFFV